MDLKTQEEIFDKVAAKMKKIMMSKGNDYAGESRLNNFHVAGNVAGSDAQGNCLQLIGTKVARLGSLFNQRRNGKSAPMNESIQDSILDLANYALLLYMIEEEAKEENSKQI